MGIAERISCRNVELYTATLVQVYEYPGSCIKIWGGGCCQPAPTRKIKRTQYNECVTESLALQIFAVGEMSSLLLLAELFNLRNRADIVLKLT